MTSGKFLNRCSFIALAAVVIVSPVSARAQDAGYAPPPMFEDMTPPMVRPETKDGYLVRPKASVNPDLPPPTLPGPAVVTPRVSADPNSPAGQAPIVKPYIPAMPAAPVTPLPNGAVEPKLMAPIVEPPARREKPATQKPRNSDDDRTVMPASKPPKKPTPPVAPVPVEQPAPQPENVPPALPSEEMPPVPAPIVPAPEAEPAPQPAPAPVMPEIQPAPASPAPTPAAPVAAPTPAPSPIPQADVPLPPSAAGPIIAPVNRDPAQSVITGPKTMPSLPVQDVDGVVTFENETAEPTILERNMKEKEAQKAQAKVEEKKAEEKTLTPIVPAPKQGVTPTNFEPGEQQGALKKLITFQPGQIGLPAAETDAIAAGVGKELDAEGHDDWRVQIKSYATPYGTGISSDRRIALSRALSLRTSLIAQGVPAARIDVLAEGLQSDSSKAGDRIDLYLYGPKK